MGSPLGLTDYDYLEYAVDDIQQKERFLLQFGFIRTAERVEADKQLKTCLYEQGDIKIFLSQSEDHESPRRQFVKKHGSGVFTVAFKCQDAIGAYEKALQAGATADQDPHTVETQEGSVTQASIRAFGDVRHTFISREGDVFLNGMNRLVHDPVSQSLLRIDHITNNVAVGEMDQTAEFYKNVFGFQETRFFDIHTERTGLLSKVLESSDGVLKMPVNEPVGKESQIQEYLDVNHGPGVQHVALTTANIIEAVAGIRENDVSFLEVPDTYYDVIKDRIPQLEENVDELLPLRILVDGDESGYLLQIFTQNLIGPFFFEVIQRKGNQGFGEGNFKALFEAIERDQVRRGVLSSTAG